MRAVTVACLLSSAVALADQPKSDDKPAITQPVRQDPVAPDQTLALKGNVVIWLDAELRIDATDKSTKVALGALEGARKDQLQHVVPVRVVGTSGDYVEVELSAASDCTWAKVRVDERLEKLRLLVKRADLAPVVAKKFAKTHPDGSRITIAPGVPVVPSADGFMISINGDDFEVAIPAALIGHSYAPPKPGRALPDRNPKKLYEVETTTSAKLLGRTVQLSAANATAETIERRKQTVLFPISAPCIAAKVAVPKSAVTRNEYGHGTGFGTGHAANNRMAQERWYLPTGTALISAGRTVAILKQEIEIAKPASNATTSCHEFTIQLHQTNGYARLVKNPAKIPLQLCAPIASVKHENPNPPRY